MYINYYRLWPIFFDKSFICFFIPPTSVLGLLTSYKVVQTKSCTGKMGRLREKTTIVSSTDNTYCVGILNQIISTLSAHISGGYITGPFLSSQLWINLEYWGNRDTLCNVFKSHWLSEANVVCCKMLANLCREIYLLHNYYNNYCTGISF